MKLNTLKLKLIQRILATDDPELLEKMLEMLAQETMVVKETQTSYNVKDKDDLIDLSTLSPEFQASIKRGLEQLDRGEGISDEEDEKYWDKWFEEN